MSYPTISKITPEEYQDRLKAIQQAFPIFGTDKSLMSYALGLSGEVGEVAEILKRYFREGTEPDLAALKKELGDVVAYVCLLCLYYGIDFEDMLMGNIQKLEERKEKGSLHGNGSDL